MYSKEPSKSKLEAKKGLTQFIVFPLDRFFSPRMTPFYAYLYSISYLKLNIATLPIFLKILSVG